MCFQQKDFILKSLRNTSVWIRLMTENLASPYCSSPPHSSRVRISIHSIHLGHQDFNRTVRTYVPRRDKSCCRGNNTSFCVHAMYQHAHAPESRRSAQLCSESRIQFRLEHEPGGVCVRSTDFLFVGDRVILNGIGQLIARVPCHQ